MPDAALSSVDFAALMQPLGPFGPAPRLAVAVSGGTDSLALAVLLQDWAAARGGSLLALTVDHGLRPESAGEARQVKRILRPLGLAHKTLTWRRDGGRDDGRGGLQAAARRARHALLAESCARRGLLFLAFAQHLDDQAETLLLRLGRGSGLDGLSAMPAVSESGAVRLLRPLLPVPKARLEATLRARGIDWIEDPSNRDPAHARVRLRRLMPALAREGLTAARLAETAGRLGRARAAQERQVARLLARSTNLDPAGFARCDPGLLAAAPAEISLRALARLLTTVGGQDYAPRLERLERLYERILGGLARGATLGGCRIAPLAGQLVIAREAAAAETRLLGAADRLLWDGRFTFALRRAALGAAGGGLRLAPLGQTGWRRLAAALPEQHRRTLPRAARGGLPALWDRQGLAAVPPIGYWRDAESRNVVKYCRFTPRNPLAPAGFTVANGARHIIS